MLLQKFGTPVVTYKNPYDFGILSDFELSNSSEITFDVLDAETDDFKSPVVYNNLSTPITLTYVNKNIKNNFQFLQSDSTIYYDGRLLKTANVDLTKLSASISFDITIVTLNEKAYTSKIYINMPYKTESRTILDGNLLQIVNLNGSGKFYQF